MSGPTDDLHLRASWQTPVSDVFMIEGCEIPLRLDTSHEGRLTDVSTVDRIYLGTISEAPELGYFAFTHPARDTTVKGPFREFRHAVVHLVRSNA